MSQASIFESSQVIEKAARVVTIWSPWWLNFINKIDWEYSESYNRITGLSSMVFLVNPSFVLSSTIMEVAVSLEYALQQATRRMDSQVHALKRRFPHASHSLISLSISLEINSDIEEKFSHLTPYTWKELVTQDIDERSIDTYGVRNPPQLPEGTMTNDTFGFPPELKAESYLRLLLEKDEEDEKNWLNEHDEYKKAGEDLQDKEDGDDSQSQELKEEEIDNDSAEEKEDLGHQLPRGKDGSTESMEDGSDLKSGDSSNKNREPKENESCNQEYDENSPLKEHQQSRSDKTSPESDSKPPKEEGGKSHQSDESNSSGDDLDGENDEIRRSEDGFEKDLASDKTQDVEGQVNDDSSQDTGDHADLDDMEESGDKIGEYPESNEGDTDPSEDTQKEHQPLDTRIRASASPVALHQMTPPQRPKEIDETIGMSEGEKEDAHKSLAQDIRDYIDGKGEFSHNGVPQGGIGVSDQFEEWAKTKLRVPKMSWKKILPKVLNQVTGKSMMSGMTDLSFSKRNPNQQENMPLMMGLITYPPTVNILIDASPSMSFVKESVLSEFIGVVSHFFMTYGEPVSIIVADNTIKYHHRSSTVSRSVKKKVARTYMGGSMGSGKGDDFGETMKKVMRGKARYKGRNIPKADITIVFTDGGFEWPYKNNGRLPGSIGSVIIVSTVDYHDLKEGGFYKLPSWVKNKKNFVSIN